MAATPRRWRLTALLILTGLCMGCNPLTVPFFLLLGADPKLDPDFKFTPPEKEKYVKLLILTSSALETRPEFLRADQELGGLVAQKLQDGFKQNKEKVLILPAHRVQRFKDEHPNWQALGPDEVAKHFGADYVIDLEIESLSLYEPGSQNTLYRGRAEISVSVIDLHKPDENPVYRKEYSTEYPRARPVLVEGSNPQQFRLGFLTRIATDISWLFTAHAVPDDFTVD
jgi:hypothetical protein